MIKCVVPVSGGKDSQACLQLALMEFEKHEVIGLFCDTQFEHPKTYAHIDFMEQHYGVTIIKVSDGDVTTRCLRYGRFPNGATRFCTDDLKIKPTKRFVENLAAKQGDGFQVWYGMRSDESSEREKRYIGKIDVEAYPLHEIMPKKYPKHLYKMGITGRLPIIDWTTQEVFELLDGKQNPLYSEGFDRVGCFPCLASGDAWKEKAFAHDDFGRSQFKLVQIVEQRTGKQVFTTKGGKERNYSGCSICSI